MRNYTGKYLKRELKRQIIADDEDLRIKLVLPTHKNIIDSEFWGISSK